MCFLKGPNNSLRYLPRLWKINNYEKVTEKFMKKLWDNYETITKKLRHKNPDISMVLYYGLFFVKVYLTKFAG